MTTCAHAHAVGWGGTVGKGGVARGHVQSQTHTHAHAFRPTAASDERGWRVAPTWTRPDARSSVVAQRTDECRSDAKTLSLPLPRLSNPSRKPYGRGDSLGCFIREEQIYTVARKKGREGGRKEGMKEGRKNRMNEGRKTGRQGGKSSLGRLPSSHECIIRSGYQTGNLKSSFSQWPLKVLHQIYKNK